ncbi:alpha-L-fucosidase [Odoribacter sp. OttesenSCG-928-L07]|nr:alpha-L-fucosidase [Odoribacter sp. OttesenSCG-928-L07]MDL2239664.1 alpha-L-fucosidase [Bacteroidales bacterium OttesenSCG-928-L14]MDL2240357.1 alpha-L-fucosidase [Bacteroidales bacterium OttesenSCG-928-K22]
MKFVKYFYILLFINVLTIFSCINTKAPEPYGKIPSKKQIEWQKLEYYMFVHFGPNTFTHVEWGLGNESPEVFNPTELDCKQWAATASAAGMKGIIITAKHHDGFCLWPSKYSNHTVRESEWKNGEGDVLKELSEACQEYKLKFGVYLSPWDRNHPSYGTDEYNTVFTNMLEEVLTNYGNVFEQWFDGANGEGENGKKQEYDWQLFNNTVYKFQPDAMIFSDVGPDCRWMGNEQGIAGETNWATLNIDGFFPGEFAPAQDILNNGNINGEKWIPAETDVSIRPGWFYSPKTNDKVKSLEKLISIYYTSIGRNSNLLLNVPPDERGKIHPNDSVRLIEFKEALDKVFENNIAPKAKVSASANRGRKFNVKNIIDNNYDSYWATPDNITNASIEFSFENPVLINNVLLQEYIPLGQRVSKFSIECWNDNKWEKIFSGTTIGYKRIINISEISCKKLRVNIEEALACPLINNIEIY